MVKYEKHFFTPQELRAAFLSLFVLIVLTGYPANLPTIVTTIEGTLSAVNESVSAAAVTLSMPSVNVAYARDFEAEASERLARLSEFNNFLARVNEEMFNLYAKSAGRLMTAAAFDADAAQVIFEENFGWFVDAQVNLSVAAAAALSDSYNSSLDAAPLGIGTISVAESDFDMHLTAAVENSVGALFWKNAVSFVSSLFSSTDILKETLAASQRR